MASSGDPASSKQVPTGTALVPATAGQQQSAQSAAAAAAMARSGGSDRKRKSGSGSKPSWMKLG